MSFCFCDAQANARAVERCVGLMFAHPSSDILHHAVSALVMGTLETDAPPELEMSGFVTAEAASSFAASSKSYPHFY